MKASVPRHRFGSNRSRASVGFLVLAFVLAVLAGPLLYVSNVLTEEDAFVALAEDAIAHPESRRFVAEVTTTVMVEVITTDETLTESLPGNVRTFLIPATRLASTQLTDGAFRLLETDVAVNAREPALREVHRQFNNDEDQIVIDLGAVLVRSSRELGGSAVGAGVAKLMASSDIGRFTIADSDSTNSQLLAVVNGLPALGGAVSIASLLSLLAAIAIAPDRRGAVVRSGLVIAGATLTSILVVSVLLFAVLGALFGGESTVGVAVAEVVSGDFAQFQSGAMVNGLVLAAIGMLFGNRPTARALRSLPADVWHHRPGVLERLASIVVDNPPGARLAGWLAGVVLLVIWPTPTLRVIVTVTVVIVLFQAFTWAVVSESPAAERLRRRFGVADHAIPADPTLRLRMNAGVATLGALLLWPAWSRTNVLVLLVLGALAQAVIDVPGARRAAKGDEVKVGQDAPAVASRRWVPLAAAVAVIAVVLGLWSTSEATDQTEAAAGCNGHVELCDRRVDEVVFAGSHNAMSSNDLGWELAMQDGDMVTQLDHGIRALLIDALYWSDEGQLDGETDLSNTAPLVEAALSDDQPQPGTWLCHGFCALGATDLTAGLADVDVWLDTNPQEVLLIIVQDEVSFEDLEAAFVASGLREKAHAHQPGTPFPTLGELIESGERILVYGESQGEPGSWFQNGFETALAETPFTFAVPSEFSCDQNRGKEDNPLFLINHWVTTGIPVREAATVINSRDSLLERVDQCQAERDRFPTVLATDFVETGDLISVVDELNATQDG